VPGHHLGGNDNLNAFGVCFYRRRLKRIALRDAVTHLIETRCLVLVHLRCLAHAGVERVRWQRQRCRPVPREALPDAVVVAGHGAARLAGAALAQV